MTVEHSGVTVVPRRVPSPSALAIVIVVFGFALVACGGNLTSLFDRGPYTSDFYDAQAHALVDGHLDIDADVAGLEGFARDGETQLYFGLTPALLRLPIAASTDAFDGRLTVVSMMLAVGVLAWAAGLVARHARPSRPDGSTRRDEWVVAAWMVLVGLGSPVLFLASRPVVYHETELWGAATAVAAMAAVLGWYRSPTGPSLVVATAATTLALSTRASVGAGALAGFGLVLAVALVRAIVPWRRLPVLILAVVVPLIPYVAVNVARFDHPLAVPFEDQVYSQRDPARQATLAATDGTLFGPEFAPTALVAYLRPDGVGLQRLYPWVTFRESATIVGAPVFDTVDRTASLPTVAPVMVVFAVVGVGATLFRRRSARDADHLVLCALAAGATVGLASTVTIAFVAQRYLSDFTPALVILGAVGLWSTVDALAPRGPVARRLVIGALTTVAAVGMAVSIALAIQARGFFILPDPDDRLALVARQYDIAAALPGDATPGLRKVEGGLGTAGPRGDLVIVDDCRGLYWSDGDYRWPLELGAPDAITLRAPWGWMTDAAAVTVLAAPNWQVDLIAEPGRGLARFRHVGTDGIRLGATFDVADVRDRDLTFSFDRVNAEIVIAAGETELLREWLVDLRGEIRVPPGAETTPVTTPLCDRLASRLEG